MKSTFIDTHCHLNFKRFKKTLDEVILTTKEKNVTICIVPGTDITLSQKAVEIASKNEGIYAAIGIHPHHAFDVKVTTHNIQDDISKLEKLIIDPKVVAVGEIGLDRHVYEDTKYPDYQISDEFMDAQKEYFIAQLHMAQKYKKALIIHNRETKKDLLAILDAEWTDDMRFRTVFHCCEPDEELLQYAIAHSIYIGVDGDVTYGGEKASFANKIPLETLVLETDSPFLLPEPLKTQKLYPNTPASIPIIAQYIADLKGMTIEEVAQATTKNARRLFNV
ncbi:MAG: TatD family hydrolase [Microgenomates group bacterium]